MLRNVRSVKHTLSGARLQHYISGGSLSRRCIPGRSSFSSSPLQAAHRGQALRSHVSRSRAEALASPHWPGYLSHSGGSLFRNFHAAAVLSGDKSIDVVTPPFAESITQGDIRWEKALNDAVETDEVLAEIETDKTNIPVPSPAGGVLVELYVEDGATVEAGTKLCKINVSDAAAQDRPATTSTSGDAPPPAAPISETPTPPSPPPPAAPAAMPTVPVDTPIPTSVPPIPPLPSEPLSQSPPPPPVPVTPSAASTNAVQGSRTEKRVKLSRMRQRIAERLKEAQNVNAMLTTFNEIDMSNIIALRARYKEEFLKKHGVKLGFMSAFVRASVHALQDQPVVNAVIDGKEIVYRDYIDISVAVATPKGLVVPVLRNVETMNFADIELGINELGVKAKEGTLAVEDMDGGTFTISNGGVFGSLYGTPIINPPQSAILGMHATKDRPVAVNGKVEIRPMMYVALTYDHRLIDGREAVLFLKKIKSAVEDPQVVLLNV